MTERWSLDLLHAYFLILYRQRGWLLFCALPFFGVTSRLLAFWQLPNGQCNQRDVKNFFVFIQEK